MQPSRRYLLPATALLLVASLPAMLGAFQARRVDPCAAPRALLETEAIPGSRHEDDHVARLSRERIQWSEGTILGARGEPTSLRFHIIRDFDGQSFFVRPFSVAVGNMEPEAQESHHIGTSAGEVEIHRALDRTMHLRPGGRSFAAWAFLYGNEPVDSALGAKLLHTLTELHQGRQPLTMFLVSGTFDPSNGEALLDRSDAWIRDAVERHVSVCGDG